MNYSGIDLHSNNCVVVVTDEQDRVLASKRLPNQLEAIIALLLPHRSELAGIVVESTYNWYWLVDGLQEAGFVVQRPRIIRQYIRRPSPLRIEVRARATHLPGARAA